MVVLLRAEDGIRDFCLSRELGDGYKRQTMKPTRWEVASESSRTPKKWAGQAQGSAHPQQMKKARKKRRRMTNGRDMEDGVRHTDD